MGAPSGAQALDACFEGGDRLVQFGPIDVASVAAVAALQGVEEQAAKGVGDPSWAGPGIADQLVGPAKKMGGAGLVCGLGGTPVGGPAVTAQVSAPQAQAQRRRYPT